MQYISIVGYLPVIRATDVVRIWHLRQSNVSFLEMLYPDSRSKLRLFGVIEIKTQSEIDREQELYLIYDS